MARNRMIRPEFWEDSRIAKHKYCIRLFFIAIWNFADDEGYFKDDPDWLKIKCFPYDKVDIPEMLAELLGSGRLELNNGIWKIKNFMKYQRINRPNESDLKDIFKQSVINHELISEGSPTKDKINKDKIREHSAACSEILNYFNEKLHKKLTPTKERIEVIGKCIDKGRGLELIKQAIDKFSLDDWSDRHKYCDLVYAIGMRSGIDNFEKWLNMPEKGKPKNDTYEL